MHDGKTKGITMPNGRAQADLIRRTYREAGLDLASKASRPQFFEAVSYLNAGALNPCSGFRERNSLTDGDVT